MKTLRILVPLFAVLTLATVNAVVHADDKPKESKALQRARKQVGMLDHIYKSAIVLITENYVNETTDVPAGTAFKKLFATVSAKGFHDVRLLDATGEPYDDSNAPRDEFEKRAVKELLAGKSYYEEVGEKNGAPVLRAVTPVPVVMKKCVMCHDNYEDVPKGQAIGAMAYVIPIE